MVRCDRCDNLGSELERISIDDWVFRLLENVEVQECSHRQRHDSL